MVNDCFRGGRRDADRRRGRGEAARARFLVEESREIVLVLDEDEPSLSRQQARPGSSHGVVEGSPLPADAAARRDTGARSSIPYEVDGRRETPRLPEQPQGELAAYEELRAGFTAAVSHELRTPLARLLVLLETADAAGDRRAAS